MSWEKLKYLLKDEQDRQMNPEPQEDDDKPIPSIQQIPPPAKTSNYPTEPVVEDEKTLADAGNISPLQKYLADIRQGYRKGSR